MPPHSIENKSFFPIVWQRVEQISRNCNNSSYPTEIVRGAISFFTTWSSLPERSIGVWRPTPQIRFAGGVHILIGQLLLDAPSIYRGIKIGRGAEVLKNEFYNLSIVTAASLVGSGVGGVIGCVIPIFGNSVGAVVGSLIGGAIGYKLEELRRQYSPESYPFNGRN